MAETTTIKGEVTSGPGTINEEIVPSSITSLDFTASKATPASSGAQRRTIDSTGAYVVLSGVGAVDTVVNATLLYLRTNAPFYIRITQNALLQIVRVHGLCILELDPAVPMTKLEAQGAGKIEYLLGGPS